MATPILPFYLEQVITDDQTDPVTVDQVLIDLKDWECVSVLNETISFYKERLDTEPDVVYHFSTHTEAQLNFNKIMWKKSWVVNQIERADPPK